MLAELRRDGWRVAIHNDYRLAGEEMTFWGFSSGDQWMKGEGKTDLEAIGQCHLAFYGTPWVDPDGDDSAPRASTTERHTLSRRHIEHLGVGDVWPSDDGRTWRVRSVDKATCEIVVGVDEPPAAAAPGEDVHERRRIELQRLGNALVEEYEVRASEEGELGEMQVVDVALRLLGEESAQLAARERLTKERDALAEETITTLRQRADRLQMALRPFAEAAATIPASTHHDAMIYMPGDTSYTRLRVQAFRDAAAFFVPAAATGSGS